MENNMADTPNAAPAAEPVSTPAVDESIVTDSDIVDSGNEPDAVTELKEAAKDPNLSKEEKKEIQKQIKKFKLKVDGQEVEEELDLSDEEAIKKHLQLSKVSQKRMQSEAQLRKAAEQFVDLLRKDPKKVLSDPNINIDLKKFAKEIIEADLEEQNKTPEQKEIEKLRADLQARIDKEKEDDENRKKSEFERIQSETEKKLESDITDALEVGNLPKTPYTVKKMAEIMMTALENDIELSPKEVIPLLRKQIQDDVKQMFSASSDDLLEELLGNENLSRLQKRRVAKAKKAIETPAEVKPTGKELEDREQKEEKKMTVREFFGV
jgi:hypothetical protein